MISYELPMSLAIASPLLIAGTLSLREIVNSQAGYNFGILPKWLIFAGPFPQIFSFIIFMIAAFAETNRIPFDLPEAENELVAGFHVEYSSMSFAAFFMAEYANMVTVCCIATLLFLGGWHPLWPVAYGSNFAAPLILFVAGAVCIYHGLNPARPLDRYTLPAFGVIFFGLAGVMLVPFLVPVLMPLFWFLAKTGFLLFVFVWIRATLPRFRYDQLMSLGWKILLPLSLSYVVVIAGATLGLDALGVPRTPVHGWPVYSLCLLALNIALVGLLFVIIDRGRLISPASARVRSAELARLRAVRDRSSLSQQAPAASGAGD